MASFIAHPRTHASRLARIATVTTLILSSVAMTLGGSAPAGAADAACKTPPPQKFAVFNEPVMGVTVPPEDSDPNTNDNTIAQVPGAPSLISQWIICLVDAATASSWIRIGIYYIVANSSLPTELDEVDQIVEALVRARQRGATVRIIVDEERYWVNKLAGTRNPSLQTLLNNGAEVSYCTSGCFGTSSGAKMHNKFLLINDVSWGPGDDWVVAQMSANWTNKQLRDSLYNSMVVMWKDSTMFEAYKEYFTDLRTCALLAAHECGSGSYPTPEEVAKSATYDTGAQFFPQSQGDPILTQLGKIVCSSGSRSVSVAMAHWPDTARGRSIANALRLRKNEGCVVRIILPNSLENRSMVDLLVKSEANGGYGLAPHCTSDDTYDADIPFTPTEHSKYVVVDAAYKDAAGNPVADSRMVFTGSHNFTENSNYANDEAWLKIDAIGTDNPINDGVVGAFLVDFGRMAATAVPCAAARALD